MFCIDNSSPNFFNSMCNLTREEREFSEKVHIDERKMMQKNMHAMTPLGKKGPEVFKCSESDKKLSLF